MTMLYRKPMDGSALDIVLPFLIACRRRQREEEEERRSQAGLSLAADFVM